MAKLGILRAEFTGAAVDALVIAAVGNGDTKVVDDAAMAISEPLRGGRRGGRDWGSGDHRHLSGYTVSVRSAPCEPFIAFQLSSEIGKVHVFQSIRGVPERKTSPVTPQTAMIASAITK